MTTTSLATDPLLFEALRHRVASIADEGSAVLKQVSSSPVATEANDCNVAVMDATGAVIAIGPGLSAHSIDCMMTARRVMADYATNPGFGDGDMFIANDPYTCSAHQTCVALVMPVFAEAELVAWVGAGIHLPDLGGPVPGQVNINATSIYEETPALPPIRIVEGHVVRKDLEAEFTGRSRTGQQVALDLRALVAANERLAARLGEMFAAYGVDSVKSLLNDVISFNEAHLVERVRSIPEGKSWSASVWLDFPRQSGIELYECRLVIERRGDRLVLDLTGSSDQAGAVINCGRPGLYAGVLNALMVLLGWGLPKCPEAMLRIIEVQSRPGSFVDAQHPAGTAKATTSACHAILLAFNVALSRMFNDVDGFGDRVLAGSGGFLPVIDIEGMDRAGKRFAVPLLDIALSSGYGAMPGRDGIDTAGPLHSPFAAISNVETHEARFPMLYLWRRQARDSGGLGRFRGGRGVELAWTPHKANGSIGAVLHGHGTAVASTPGIGGGHPGATNTFSIARSSRTHDRLRQGRPPLTEGEFELPPEAATGLFMTRLKEDDVVIARNSGGGGWGDPLERDPELVLADVCAGATSIEWAVNGYGVVTDNDGIDAEATQRHREAMRRARTLHTPPLLDPATCDHSTSATTQMGLPTLGACIIPHEAEPRFEAEQDVCQLCGALLDTRVVPIA
jgi:N-methylhydantoinase B